MDLSHMSPRRPYILRALYDWLLDNQLTPHLVVNVTLAGVEVPIEFARDGQIILNIAPRAVGGLELGNDAIHFHARFGGVSHQVYVPMYAVIAIYARENGAGMMFEDEPGYQLLPEDQNVTTEKPLITLVDVNAADVEGPSPDDSPPKPPRGRPGLRVVK